MRCLEVAGRAPRPLLPDPPQVIRIYLGQSREPKTLVVAMVSGKITIIRTMAE